MNNGPTNSWAIVAAKFSFAPRSFSSELRTEPQLCQTTEPGACLGSAATFTLLVSIQSATGVCVLLGFYAISRLFAVGNDGR